MFTMLKQIRAGFRRAKSRVGKREKGVTGTFCLQVLYYNKFMGDIEVLTQPSKPNEIPADSS